MDDRWENEIIEYGAVNISGLRILNTSKKQVLDFLDEWKKLDSAQSPGAGQSSISAQAALMYDAVLVLIEVFNKLLRKKSDVFKNNKKNVSGSSSSSVGNLDCNTEKEWVNPWEHGDKIIKLMRKVCFSIVIIRFSLKN